jgi:hypothetical protein
LSIALALGRGKSCGRCGCSRGTGEEPQERL